VVVDDAVVEKHGTCELPTIHVGSPPSVVPLAVVVKTVVP
jgi:hypothetical protein